MSPGLAKLLRPWSGHRPRTNRMIPLIARLAAFIDYPANDAECWPWMGYRNKSGHGRVSVDGRLCLAHRVVYEILVGPIPQGLILDHLCRNPPCCNPAHLEPVTQRENLVRGVGWAGQHARKTHCVNGHAFTPENTYVAPSEPGTRRCRTCRNRRNQERL